MKRISLMLFLMLAMSASLYSAPCFSQTESKSYGSVLDANKGIFFTRKLKGIEYAVAIKKMGFGYELSLHKRDADGIKQIGSSFIGEEAIRQIFMNKPTKLTINLETGSQRGHEVELKLNDYKIERIKFPGVSSAVQVSRRHPNERQSLLGKREDLKTIGAFLARNEGVFEALATDKDQVSLSIENGQFGGYKIRVTKRNAAGEEVLSGHRWMAPRTSDSGENTDRALRINKANTITISLDSGTERRKDLYITLTETGHIKTFSIQASPQTKASVSCRQLMNRVIFNQPFH